MSTETQAGWRLIVARIYASGIVLSALIIIVQGITFGGFYSGRGNLLQVHEYLGTISGFVVLFILATLGFLAKFPKAWRIGWLTLALGILWNVQAHVFGYGIEDERTLEMVHIPVAFLIFGLALFLAAKTYNVLIKRKQ